jgi:hypothetical protein
MRNSIVAVAALLAGCAANYIGAAYEHCDNPKSGRWFLLNAPPANYDELLSLSLGRSSVENLLASQQERYHRTDFAVDWFSDAYGDLLVCVHTPRDDVCDGRSTTVKFHETNGVWRVVVPDVEYICISDPKIR